MRKINRNKTNCKHKAILLVVAVVAELVEFSFVSNRIKSQSRFYTYYIYNINKNRIIRATEGVLE